MLEGYLFLAKRLPVDQTQKWIGGGGVQSLGGVVEIESQVLALIKLASSPTQICCQVLPNLPVALIVGIGQGGPVNSLAKIRGVHHVRVGFKRHLDVEQALSSSKFGKNQSAKMLRTNHGAVQLNRQHSAQRCN
jgi:hypothetical protein